MLVNTFLSFNSEYLSTKLHQYTSLVTRSSPNFQYFISLANVQQFALISYRIRLRNGLPIANRKSNIFISLVPECFIEEKMPRYFSDCMKNTVICYAS